jgi:hypothetical protein
LVKLIKASKRAVLGCSAAPQQRFHVICSLLKYFGASPSWFPLLSIYTIQSCLTVTSVWSHICKIASYLKTCQGFRIIEGLPAKKDYTRASISEGTRVG